MAQQPQFHNDQRLLQESAIITHNVFQNFLSPRRSASQYDSFRIQLGYDWLQHPKSNIILDRTY